MPRNQAHPETVDSSTISGIRVFTGPKRLVPRDVSNDREISRVPKCVSFVLTLQCPNAGMSLECGNQSRWVSTSKLRPKCVDAGGGDAELRDSGQHVDKGDIDNWCTTLEFYDRTSCAPPRFPARGTKRT